MAMIIYMDLNFFFVFQYLCRTFPIVDDHVHDAMGDNLYDLFMVSQRGSN